MYIGSRLMAFLQFFVEKVIGSDPVMVLVFFLGGGREKIYNKQAKKTWSDTVLNR
jgi:hypothetical protein